MDAYYPFAMGLGIGDVHNAALGRKVGVVPARSMLRKGDADFEVGADGDVETRHEGGPIAAKIFAGGIFFEGKSTGIAAANP